MNNYGREMFLKRIYEWQNKAKEILCKMYRHTYWKIYFRSQSKEKKLQKHECSSTKLHILKL